jgi:tricorn protease
MPCTEKGQNQGCSNLTRKRTFITMKTAFTLALALAAQATIAGTNNVGLPRFPAVSPEGSSVVFSWHGDLWRVDTAGGRASRLTSHPGEELYSVFSPDGKQIAFTSDRIGGGNLFIMNADGTALRQVTVTDRYFVLSDWFQDELLFHGRIEHDWYPALRSYSIQTRGGDPTRLFDAFGSTPSISPDGSRILLTRGASSWTRRNYRGPDARDVWVFDRKSGAYTQITRWNGNDGRAKWIDNETFVFSSDQNDETVNLYLMKLGTDPSHARRLTEAKGVDVEEFDISQDGKTLIYQQWDRLYRLDLSSADSKPAAIDIEAAQDRPNKTEYKAVDRLVSEAALSPDGKTMAVIAYGRVYVRGSEAKAETRAVAPQLTPASDVVWSPDGQTLYFVADMDGQDAIYTASATLSRSDVKKAIADLRKPTTAPATQPYESASTQASTAPTTQPSTQAATQATTEPATQSATAPATQPTSQPTTSPTSQPAKPEVKNRWPDALRFEVRPFIAASERCIHPTPSPDGKLLAFMRGEGQLWVRDLQTGDDRRLFDGWSDALELRWSPDSTQIAFVTEDVDNNRDIFITPADGSEKPINISRHPDNDYSPRWSADGKILAFLSQRNENESDVYSVMLDRDLESLSGSDLDNYYKEAAEKAKKREKPKPGSIAATTQPSTQPATRPATLAATKPTTKPAGDVSREELESAYLRLRRLTSMNGSEANLEIAPAGDKVYFSAQATGGRAIFVLDRAAPDPKQLGKSVEVAGITFEGDKLVVVDAGRAGTMNLASGAVEYIDISDRLAIDRSTAMQDSLAQAARILGQTYYDPTMNHLDWPAVTERYRALVADAVTPGEFDYVAAKLVGELNGSHLGINMPDVPNPDAIGIGRLGIKFTREDEGYRVSAVLRDATSAIGEMKLEIGDLIIAIEGEDLVAPSTLDSRLVNRTGRETLVTVRRSIDGIEKTIDLLLMPINFEAEAALFYSQWRTETADAVAKLSDGKIGYIHIRGMDQGSLDVFERDLFAAAEGKKGLIIDVRNNGGGWTTDRLLASIMYPRHAYTRPRGYAGDTTDSYPQDRLFIQKYSLPINMLCNEKSFSNAEIVSHAFKNLKRGTLVGQQTAGGVISTGGTSLLDGTTVRLPGRGWYTPDGKNMELNGAMPDLLVPQTPEAESQADDRQLKAAVEDLLKRLK